MLSVSPDLRLIVEQPLSNQPLAAVTITRGSTVPIEVQFVRNGTTYDPTFTQTSGALTIGYWYKITSFVSGDDFTNLGAGSNATGQYFKSTGTTPTTWTHATELQRCSSTGVLFGLKWTVKEAGKFDDAPLVLAAGVDFTTIGSGSTVSFRAECNYYTAALNTLLGVGGTSADDVAEVALMGEIAWVGPEADKARKIVHQFDNDVNKGDADVVNSATAPQSITFVTTSAESALGASHVITGSSTVTVTVSTGLVTLTIPASVGLTGAPTAPTAALGTNTTQIATTAFVLANSSATWGTITGTLSAQTDLQAALNAKGSGTITSVAASVPSFLSLSGSPITTSGTLAITLQTQVQKTFFAGPTSGADAAPTFRAIAAADVPTLNQNTTGSSASATLASTVTVLQELSDATCFLAFVTASSGSLGIKTNVGLVFNSLTGALSFEGTVESAGFTGPLTGNASTANLANTVTTNANLTGIVTSTGNATAIADGAIALSKLATAPVTSVTGTTNEIVSTGGATPSISLPAALTFTGKTVTGGTFSSPALVTPSLGTPTSGVATNLTGTAALMTVGTSQKATLANEPFALCGFVLANAGSLTGAQPLLTNSKLSFDPQNSVLSLTGDDSIFYIQNNAGTVGFEMLPDEFYSFNASGTAAFQLTPNSGNWIATVPSMAANSTFALLEKANTWTAAQAFTTITGTSSLTLGVASTTAGTVVLKNATSTGNTTLATANVSATNYTATLQAGNGTLAFLTDIPTVALTVGTTAISSGTATRLLYETSGNKVGEISGATSDGTTLTLVAPILGTPASGTLTNCTGLPMTTGITGILAGANGGTGVANTGKTITLAGNLITTGAFNTTFAQAATTTVTLPSTSATMARTDAAQTFTGNQGFSNRVTIDGALWMTGYSAGAALIDPSGGVVYTNGFWYYGGSIRTGSNLQVDGSTTLSVLNASKPVFTDGSKVLVSGSFSVPQLVATGNATAQSAANTSVATYTTPNDSTVHSFRVGGYANITAISAGTLTVQVSFTDETGTAQTLNYFGMGLTSAGLTTTGFTGFSASYIRCNPNTAITFKTTFTGVSIVYDVGCSMESLY